MPCQVIFSYNSAYPRGYIVDVVSMSHEFTKNETLDGWINSGGTLDNWVRPYGIWVITDRSLLDMQWVKDPFILYVTDPPTADGRKYSFREPLPEEAAFGAISLTGKFTSTFNEGAKYILERE